jgi:hypothetical protein
MPVIRGIKIFSTNFSRVLAGLCDELTKEIKIISFIRIEKSPFSRQRRRNSKANTSSGSHRKNQTRGDKKQTKNEKHTPV